MKKMIKLSIFIFTLLGILQSAFASGALESQVLEIRMLMMPSPEDTTSDYIIRNIEAAEMLASIIEENRDNEDLRSNDWAQILFLQAEAYHNAKEFNQESRVLNTIVQNYNEHFDEAERRLNAVRSIQNQYNTILGLFIQEIRKSPNDPDDPFNEVLAFQYINQMSELLSNQNERILEELQSYRDQIKLTIDRGYRDRIIDLARSFILEDNFVAAMNRYLEIQDIDETDYYETSFDLRKEEFLRLNAPNEFFERVESLSGRIQELNAQFANQNELLVSSVPQFILEIPALFPDDPLEIQAPSIAEQPRIAQVLNELPMLLAFSNEIQEISEQILLLEEELYSYDLGDFNERDTEHIYYLQQFVAGTGLSSAEGIEEVAHSQSRSWVNEIKSSLNERRAVYFQGVQEAYSSRERGIIENYQNAYQEFSEFYLAYLAYLSQGQDIDRRDRNDFISQLLSDDQSDAARVYVERASIADHLVLLEYYERNQILVDQNYTFSEELLAAFQSGQTIVDEIVEYSNTFISELTSISASLGPQNEGVNTRRYRTIHEQNRDSILGSIAGSITPYIQRYQDIILGPITASLPSFKNDLALSQSELAGLEVDFQFDTVNSTDIHYFPRRALNRLLPVLEATTEFLGQIVSIEEVVAATVGESEISSEISAINAEREGIRQELETLMRTASDAVDQAGSRVAQADAFIANARNSQENFLDASVNGNYDRASEFFVIIEDSYNESLNIDYDQDILDERNEILEQFSSELSEIFFATINAQKAEALQRVATALNDNEYFLARDALEDAKIFDDQLSLGRDPIITAYENEIERLILLSSVRDVPPPSDSRYSRISNDLNESGKSLVAAQGASEEGNAELLVQEIRTSRRFLESVLDQIPANFQAALINLQLIQLENPLGFNEFFAEEVEEIEILIYGSSGEFASGEYSGYGDIEKDQLLSRIAALNELGSDSRLDRFIIDIEVDLGRRESPEIIQARNNANAFVNQARSLIAQAQGESDPSVYEGLLNQSLDRLRQAQDTYPLIPDISSLISEAEVLLGREITVSLPYEANQVFEQAISLFVNQDLVGAKNLLDVLWNNVGYRSYFPLRDIITQLYNILGQNLPS